MIKKRVIFGTVALEQYQCPYCGEWQFESDKDICCECGKNLKYKKDKTEPTEYRSQIGLKRWQSRISKKVKENVFTRDDFICQYCGRRCYDSWITDKRQLTVDHIVPVTGGGGRSEENLITACRECNSVKGNRRFKTIDDAREYILNQLGLDKF